MLTLCEEPQTVETNPDPEPADDIEPPDAPDALPSWREQFWRELPEPFEPSPEDWEDYHAAFDEIDSRVTDEDIMNVNRAG